jgi:hypothetical protein
VAESERGGEVFCIGARVAALADPAEALVFRRAPILSPVPALSSRTAESTI